MYRSAFWAEPCWRLRGWPRALEGETCSDQIAHPRPTRGPRRTKWIVSLAQPPEVASPGSRTVVLLALLVIYNDYFVCARIAGFFCSGENDVDPPHTFKDPSALYPFFSSRTSLASWRRIPHGRIPHGCKTACNFCLACRAEIASAVCSCASTRAVA